MNDSNTCDSCQSAPSTVYCRADLAYLCAGCDAEIHSANLIASHHLRIPIPPISVAAGAENHPKMDCDDEAAMWVLLDPVRKGSHSSSGFLFGREVDEYLDLLEYNQNMNINQHMEDQFGQQLQQSYGKNEVGEYVVPVQCVVGNELQQSHQMEMEYEVSSAGFSYTPSVAHSVSFSAMEARSTVPDTTVTDISNSHNQPSKVTIDLFGGPPLQIPTQFTPMDREARVLRYREKKKARKFDKMIRYASRKAYAERRPRIKGRFAKRSETELEVNQMLSNYVTSEGSYGIVPSFDSS